MSRFLLLFLLRRLRHGRIVLGEGERRMRLGEPSDLTVEVRVDDRAAYRQALLHGSTGLADGYVDGRWDCDDLVGLIRIGARNAGWLDRLRRRFSFALAPWHRLRALLRPNTLQRAREDVAAHYDLSNELYELFLDETMAYSCAIFESGMTLREAQEAKYDESAASSISVRATSCSRSAAVGGIGDLRRE